MSQSNEAGAPKSRRRTRLSPEARRAQLVEAATELLVSRPLDELSADTVADAAGVSRALVFHYFPTQQALHLAAVSAAAARLVEAVDDALEGAADERRAGIEAFIDFVDQQPGTFAALSAMSAADPDFASVFDSTRMLLARRTLGGSFSNDQSSYARALGWIALIERAVPLWLSGPRDDSEEFVTVLIESIFTLNLAPHR